MKSRLYREAMFSVKTPRTPRARAILFADTLTRSTKVTCLNFLAQLELAVVRYCNNFLSDHKFTRSSPGFRNDRSISKTDNL